MEMLTLVVKVKCKVQSFFMASKNVLLVIVTS